MKKRLLALLLSLVLVVSLLPVGALADASQYVTASFSNNSGDRNVTVAVIGENGESLGSTTYSNVGGLANTITLNLTSACAGEYDIEKVEKDEGDHSILSVNLGADTWSCLYSSAYDLTLTVYLAKQFEEPDIEGGEIDTAGLIEYRAYEPALLKLLYDNGVTNVDENTEITDIDIKFVRDYVFGDDDYDFGEIATGANNIPYYHASLSDVSNLGNPSNIRYLTIKYTLNGGEEQSVDVYSGDLRYVNASTPGYDIYEIESRDDEKSIVAFYNENNGESTTWSLYDVVFVTTGQPFDYDDLPEEPTYGNGSQYIFVNWDKNPDGGDPFLPYENVNDDTVVYAQKTSSSIGGTVYRVWNTNNILLDRFVELYNEENNTSYTVSDVVLDSVKIQVNGEGDGHTNPNYWNNGWRDPANPYYRVVNSEIAGSSQTVSNTHIPNDKATSVTITATIDGTQNCNVTIPIGNYKGQLTITLNAGDHAADIHVNEDGEEEPGTDPDPDEPTGYNGTDVTVQVWVDGEAVIDPYTYVELSRDTTDTTYINWSESLEGGIITCDFDYFVSGAGDSSAGYDCVDIKVKLTDDAYDAYVLQGIRSYQSYGERGTNNVRTNGDGTYTIDNVCASSGDIDAYIYLYTKYSVEYYKDDDKLTDGSYADDSVYITGTSVRASTAEVGYPQGAGAYAYMCWKNDACNTSITLPALPTVDETQTITGWYLNGKTGDVCTSPVDVDDAKPGGGTVIKFYAVTGDKTPEEPEEPDAPTYGELKGIIGKVTVDCTTFNDHADAEYDLIDGSYELGNVTQDENGVYTIVVEIKGDEYLNKYNETNSGHTLVSENPVSVTLTYGENGWAAEIANVKFEVQCRVFTFTGTADEHSWIEPATKTYSYSDTEEFIVEFGANDGYVVVGVKIDDKVIPVGSMVSVISSGSYIFDMKRDHTMKVVSAPAAPTTEELAELLDGQIKVYCANTYVEHPEKTYGLLGEPELSNPKYSSGPSTLLPITVTVTLDTEAYLEAYSKDVGLEHEELTLEGWTYTVDVTYDGNEWSLVEGETIDAWCYKITDFTKELETDYATYREYNLKYPQFNWSKDTVIVDEGDKVTLLYKLTLTANELTKYEITDPGAVVVDGSLIGQILPTDDGTDYTGLNTVTVYVAKTFTWKDILNSGGELSNTATVSIVGQTGTDATATEETPVRIDWDINIPPVTEPEDEFVPKWLNTEDHYAYIVGYEDGTIKPNNDITRAEVATIFFRLLNDDARARFWSTTNDFTDVAEDSWYNNAISTLSNMGIINGYEDGTFKPNAPITRAEFTAIATRFFDYEAEYDGAFNDVSARAWYADYVQAAVDMGLVDGYPDGGFHPDAYITRAEACTIVNRVLHRVPHEDHLLAESVMNTWPDNPKSAWYYEDMQEATNSHDYDWIREDGETVEDWTKKLPERDWSALETEWATAYSR